MKKVLFVFHAKAGKGSIRNHLLDLVTAFNQKDCAVTIMTTLRPGHATDIVAKYGEDYDIILCSGGDGTVSEVVAGVLQLKEKKPVAYLPTGTTNDFASSLGLPRDMEECIAHISGDEVMALDIGRLDQRVFVYVAAFGSLAQISYTTPQGAKNVWGYLAYMMEAMKQLPNIQVYHLKINCDGVEYEDDYIIGMICNSYSVAGFKGITGNEVSLNDGKFEVILIKDTKNPMDFAITMTSLLNEPNPRFVQRLTAQHMTIESSQPMDWVLDGEFGGTTETTEFSVAKQAVEFFV